MKVLDIIKLTATYLQLNELLQTSILGGNQTADDDVLKEINLLETCVNLVNSQIASEYLPLTKTITTKTQDSKIPFSIFLPYKLSEIYKITDNFGNYVVYKIFDDHIKTNASEVIITFRYLPQNLSISENIVCYPTKLSERIFAYGVASEYCFIKSLYDDATMWDLRFKNAMQAITSKKGEVRIKARRWL